VKVSDNDDDDYDHLSVYSQRLGSFTDRSLIPIMSTILIPIVDLVSVYLKGGSYDCKATKPIAITAFFRFWDTVRIYCPSDYTIPAKQILGTNHMSYHPDLNNVDLRFIKDSLSFFPFFNDNVIVTSIFPDIMNISSRLWNNYTIPEQKDKEARSLSVNNLYKHVMEANEHLDNLSVVIFISGHSRQDCSIYHWQPFYDGCICMSLLTGMPITLLYNGYFRSEGNQEHFRQIVSKPIHVKRIPSGDNFDFQDFKKKNKAYINELNSRIEKELTFLSARLRDMHRKYDSYLNTDWSVEPRNKNCPKCH
jgi:hypothetical protein